MLLDRFRIRTKLGLLAGIPVLGALLLSTIVIQGARRSAKTAEAIGSIEDLAELSDRMRDVVTSLQNERARTAWTTGQRLGAESPELIDCRNKTDANLARLTHFVGSRDQSMLPPKLARELGRALHELTGLSKFRAELATEKVPLDRQLDFFANPVLALVGATAALNELSDDGSLLRGISSLASAMEVKERQSLEHALLAHVFALTEFPPGSFRRFVSLDTEEQVYTASYTRSASERERKVLEQAMLSQAAKSAALLKKAALQATDELTIDSKQWYDAQAALVADLGGVEKDLGQQVRRAAIEKIADARHAVRIGIGLTIAVLVVSMALALVIARRILRSVNALSRATEKVRNEQDYSVRAEQFSRDELGKLTDAFNEMLAGIQDRDRQLADHREGLERLVADRTSELSARNAAMRVVLDNVAQGLATAGIDGRLSSERSAAFDRWFGAPDSGSFFGEHIAGDDKRLAAGFSVAFEQVIEDVIPIEVSLEMMPKLLERHERFYSLDYAPVSRDEKLDGVLLMVTDITSRVHAERAEAEQREQIKTFQRVLNDRAGFIEFFTEARHLVERIRDDDFVDDAERRRVVHTLKGNASLFDLSTVVTAAHNLEQAYDEAITGDLGRLRDILVCTWDSFAQRAVALLGEDLGDRFELSKAELDALLVAIRQGVTRAELEFKIARLAFEPMQTRLARIGSQLCGLARRFGKPEPRVVIDDGDVRLPAAAFAPLWAAFAHLVRNIVDHGLEDEETRVQSGKPQQPRVDLTARESQQRVVIEVRDDGRGIDWDRVREKAKQKGLPSVLQADLVAALQSPGFSTAAQVTTTSGRGVGLAAVVSVVRALGGTFDIESAFGKGTKMTITVGQPRELLNVTSPRLSSRPLSLSPPARPPLAPRARGS
jgi:two-component system chemotaxis sensor kinase CheA